MIDGDDPLVLLGRRRGLLEGATRYARHVTAQVTRRQLALPTPCADWDLLQLLWHVNESVAALREAIEQFCVFPEPVSPDPAGVHDVLRAFDWETSLLLQSWDEAAYGADTTVAVGRYPVHGMVLANTGALEIAVHGWDVASACDLPEPIPAGLAADLFAVARKVVPLPRYPQFGPEVACPGDACASDRLVAFLGRRPASWCPKRGTGGGSVMTGACEDLFSETF
ncbi:TIGR03086 family metal-binding protein [Saccharothrix sp. HUAS TT1]|uniref:TIGR03086 family metal-binding protein n=1 Tax=unclassified Saccharothrix TaxID=2593673 RepID=UPI00345B8790